MQVVQTKYKTVSNLEGREFVEKKLILCLITSLFGSRFEVKLLPTRPWHAAKEIFG